MLHKEKGRGVGVCESKKRRSVGSWGLTSSVDGWMDGWIDGGVVIVINQEVRRVVCYILRPRCDGYGS